MKLHDLHPATGAHKARTRVGRGIAAGQGKTAGRGTKGQKARAGGSIPPWFEGGQTPLHMRIPKLRGFKNRFKVEFEVVNVGAIGALAEAGAFETEAPGAKGSKAKAAPQITINQDILRAVGLVRTLDKPLKVLGAGDVSVPLFVVADAFSVSARTKIEAAGGSVNVLEVPTTKSVALKGKSKAAADEATPAATAAAETASAETVAPEAVAPNATAADASTEVAPAKASKKRATKAQPAEAAAATAEPAAEPETIEPETIEPETAEPTGEADLSSDEAETTSGGDA
jgi:large subunit ribosomal protein L15